MGTSGGDDLQSFVRGEDLVKAVTNLQTALASFSLPTPAGLAPTLPLTATGAPFNTFVSDVTAALSSVIKGE